MSIEWTTGPSISPEQGGRYLREAARGIFDLAMRDGQVIDMTHAYIGPGNRDMVLTVVFRHNSALTKDPTP